MSKRKSRTRIKRKSTRESKTIKKWKKRSCFPDSCAKCHKRVKFYWCKVKGCERPGRHKAFWYTTRAKWNKLPKSWRNRVLCKACFKELSGVAPGPQCWDVSKI